MQTALHTYLAVVEGGGGGGGGGESYTPIKC